MIPISLSVQNFLSYGEGVPPLDFTGFHVACISGRNGHGKSALLDAITWALWGEARKSGVERRPSEGLLRIGTTEMQVDFEFHLEGTRYRVSRSFRKTTRTGTTRLEVQIYSPETGSYKTISEEDSVRKTQDRLNGLLRMNYDTFINSAFLLQGRADEFTRRNARERKNILADILGLSRYDDLSGLSRTYAQQAEVQYLNTQTRLTELDAIIAQKGDIQKKCDMVHEQMIALEKDLETTENHLDIVRKNLAKRERLITERDGLRMEIERIDREMAETKTLFEISQKHLQTVQDVLLQKDAIEADAEKYRTLQQAEAALQKKAHDVRPLEQRANELQREIDKARYEVERRLGEWELRIKDNEREIAEAQALLHDKEDMEARVETLRKAREQDRHWQVLREQRDLIERTIRDLERQVDSACTPWQVAHKTRQEQRERLEKLSGEKTNRRPLLEAAQKQQTAIKTTETERDQVRDRGSALNIQIETETHHLKALQKTCVEIEHQQAALRQVTNTQCPLCGSTLNDTHRAEVLANLEAQFRQAQSEMQTLKITLQKAETEREHLRRHYQELKNRLSERERVARAVAEAEAALQESENATLELETIKRDILEIENKLKEQTENSSDARALAQARRDHLTNLYPIAEHRTLQAKLKELETVETHWALILAAEERLKKARETLPTYHQKRDMAKQWLDEERYAIKERKALKEIFNKIQTLAYSPEQHQMATHTLQQLKDAPMCYERLQAAQRECAGAQQRHQMAQTRLISLLNLQQQAAHRLPDLDRAIIKSEVILQEAETVHIALRTKRSQRDQLLQQQAGLQTQIDQCQQMESERPTVIEKAQKAQKEARIYKELVTAFGKDGIQALIIEQAIPEIETETNRILSRLTDNRTQISIESLRDLKKGGTRETLDIKISDELGERSYELYSGGEAFRVDFAVRISLSKLLASRTGTRLRTLIIDEGFGTQDAEGIDNLVEAIQAISEDFEKILVITHVESLKQAFPVRIEVTKYPDQGSRYEVLY